jgi:hypothetical protein
MNFLRTLIADCSISLFCLTLPLAAEKPVLAPLPDLRQLMTEVEAHQKQLEKVRENYTFTAQLVTQELDSNRQVKKTESLELEEFFVNGNQIGRKVKKDGKPLDEQAQQKETERVTKEVEKAQTPSGERKMEENNFSLVRLLGVVEVGQARRENFRGRPTIVCEFVGRKDAKANGMSEDAYKKMRGTIWIDEADHEVTRLEATFYDNFQIGFGLLARIQKGSRMNFDQAKINGEIWLPTTLEAVFDARLLFKGIHAHVVEQDSNFQRFRVETLQIKDTVSEKKP